MKRQTGVRVEAEVWGAYRLVCGREKLRPSFPIEAFLRFVLENDSVLSVLSMMRGVAKSRAEGFEAYARVLLDWFTHGKVWLGGEVSVEGLLLEALKLVADAELRGRIEEALIAHQRKRYLEKRGALAVEEVVVDKVKAEGGTGKVEGSENVQGEESRFEKFQEKLDELKRLKAASGTEKEN